MGQIHLTLLILVCTKKNQTLKKSSDLYFSLERGPLCSEEISWVWNLSSHMCSLQGIGNYKAESKYYLSPVFLEVWQFVHDSTHTLLSRDRSRAFKSKYMRKIWKGLYFIFLGSKIYAEIDCSHALEGLMLRLKL